MSCGKNDFDLLIFYPPTPTALDHDRSNPPLTKPTNFSRLTPNQCFLGRFFLKMDRSGRDRRRVHRHLPRSTSSQFHRILGVEQSSRPQPPLHLLRLHLPAPASPDTTPSSVAFTHNNNVGYNLYLSPAFSHHRVRYRFTLVHDNNDVRYKHYLSPAPSQLQSQIAIHPPTPQRQRRRTQALPLPRFSATTTESDTDSPSSSTTTTSDTSTASPPLSATTTESDSDSPPDSTSTTTTSDISPSVSPTSVSDGVSSSDTTAISASVTSISASPASADSTPSSSSTVLSAPPQFPSQDSPIP
ncbi:hypothetical protein C8F04DRAFT_505099 [Mycena alexandri]|uniref:Uncharacterized protein n=1 Tax=Mycena alexandri TaxID=1745969 RepID=A0AAD6WKA5_9AGAR|nr:hypothetical protein C8F04DRAFT_505099 [Mycena alexandri]